MGRGRRRKRESERTGCRRRMKEELERRVRERVYAELSERTSERESISSPRKNATPPDPSVR